LRLLVGTGCLRCVKPNNLPKDHPTAQNA
jgi:hypothetical protein